MAFDFNDRVSRPRTTKEEKEYFHIKQRGRCMYCGTKLRKGDEHVDHTMPLSRCGRNTPSNKQLLCGPCNKRKGDK
jgi:5-methylcytosine-specific restriction endonuclease McrA